ncbi:hypothetical protein BGZ94_003527 [Podila epigama]|nr:hypothetical protein BGZ94_003527 [Podila epigama]
MPRSILLDQEIVLTILALYTVTVAFDRWLPEAGGLIPVHARPKAYLPTFQAASEFTLALYAISLMVDFFRAFLVAALESAAISFASRTDTAEQLSLLPFVAALVPIAKDVLLLACLFAFPEPTVAAEYASIVMPIAVKVEQAMYIIGLVALVRGLYVWTYAIGRDKRQVIPNVTTKSQ